MDGILVMPPKRYTFNVMHEKIRISALMADLPEDSVYKLVSAGGFSSIGFIRLVADKTRINTLTASTLAIGKQHLIALDVMHQQGKLGKARFIVGKFMKARKEEGKYGYFKMLVNVCKKNGWDLVEKNNHSKIILFDTDIGKYVLETSSNLTENPNMEQFSFEKSEELYDFYNELLIGILKGGIINDS